VVVREINLLILPRRKKGRAARSRMIKETKGEYRGYEKTLLGAEEVRKQALLVGAS